MASWAGIPTEYVGLNVACDIRLSLIGTYVAYKAAQIRITLDGSTGNVTSGEDLSERQVPQVPKYEIEITKASYDPENDPFGAAFDFLEWGAFIDIRVYPGGRTGTVTPWLFAVSLINRFGVDSDANGLQPVSLSAICAAGNDPDEWYNT